MNSRFREFHKTWMEQCAATEDIRERFGVADALEYLIGEKLFSFVRASEQDPAFTAELPQFIAEVRRLFSVEEVRAFLDDLERTKFLASTESDTEHADLDDDPDEELLLDNPVLGAAELLRFARVRELLL